MTSIRGKWGIGRPGADKPLQDHIGWYVMEQGYQVVSQTETSAQLVKPKSFSFGWAFLWFLFFGIGLLVYVLYYMMKSDGAIYLYVEDGKVLRR